eukprot:GEMP01024176.1.p1 GENE.GEMP01024176.1~~GEMP01024176.1.p1  ORF type:complete len:392 (+),score=37.65 GEMP01024176.1:107-1282(+)
MEVPEPRQFEGWPATPSPSPPQIMMHPTYTMNIISLDLVRRAAAPFVDQMLQGIHKVVVAEVEMHLRMNVYPSLMHQHPTVPGSSMPSASASAEIPAQSSAGGQDVSYKCKKGDPLEHIPECVELYEQKHVDQINARIETQSDISALSSIPFLTLLTSGVENDSSKRPWTNEVPPANIFGRIIDRSTEKPHNVHLAVALSSRLPHIGPQANGSAPLSACSASQSDYDSEPRFEMKVEEDPAWQLRPARVNAESRSNYYPPLYLSRPGARWRDQRTTENSSHLVGLVPNAYTPSSSTHEAAERFSDIVPFSLSGDNAQNAFRPENSMVCRHWKSKGYCKLNDVCKFQHLPESRGSKNTRTKDKKRKSNVAHSKNWDTSSENRRKGYATLVSS